MANSCGPQRERNIYRETKDYSEKYEYMYLLSLRTIFKTPSPFGERIKRT
jgi:hypothetical protein